MLGLLLFQLLGLLIVVVIIAGVAASGGSDASFEVESGSILHLRLDQPLVERSNDNPLTNIDWVNLRSNQGLSVQELLVVLHHSAKDPKIQGVFLDLSDVQGDMTQRDQVREGLERFKRSGKWIIAHSESYTQGTLLLASMAKPLCMVPTGIAMLNGLATEPVFLKGMFEKLDMEIELIRVGKFKGAGEMLVRKPFRRKSFPTKRFDPRSLCRNAQPPWQEQGLASGYFAAVGKRSCGAQCCFGGEGGSCGQLAVPGSGLVMDATKDQGQSH